MQTQSQVPPAQSPAPEQAPAPERSTGLAPRGNQARQEQIDTNGVAAGQGALRDNTTSASISVSGRLPANTVLGEAEGNRVSTEKDTSFTVGVGRSGIFASFHPALLVRPGTFAARMLTGGISLTQLYFDFQRGTASLSLDTGWSGDVIDWFTDFKAGIEQKFAAGIKGSLPERIRGGNYDPYSDPELGTMLQGVAGAISSSFPTGGGGGSGLLDKITGPKVSANFTAKAQAFPMTDSMEMKIKEGAHIELSADMEGTMGGALRQPKVKQITVWTDGLSIEHKSAGVLAGLTLHSMTLGPDLSVTGLDYDLGLEDAAGGLKLLAMLVQLRTGQDLGVRDVNRPEFKAIREDVDRQAREKLPQLLRQQLLDHDGAIPGMSLQSMFRGGGR